MSVHKHMFLFDWGLAALVLKEQFATPVRSLWRLPGLIRRDAHLREHFDGQSWTTVELIKVASDRPPMGDFTFPDLRDLLLRVAGEGGAVSGRCLGKFLSKISGRVVGRFRLETKRDSSHGNRFSLRPAPQGGAHTDCTAPRK